MDGLDYIEKIKAKIREAKALKEYGVILKRLYIKAMKNGDRDRAESLMSSINGVKELLDELDVYGSEKEREYTTEEIEKFLDKK